MLKDIGCNSRDRQELQGLALAGSSDRKGLDAAVRTAHDPPAGGKGSPLPDKAARPYLSLQAAKAPLPDKAARPSLVCRNRPPAADLERLVTADLSSRSPFLEQQYEPLPNVDVWCPERLPQLAIQRPGYTAAPRLL